MISEAYVIAVCPQFTDGERGDAVLSSLSAVVALMPRVREARKNNSVVWVDFSGVSGGDTFVLDSLSTLSGVEIINLNEHYERLWKRRVKEKLT